MYLVNSQIPSIIKKTYLTPVGAHKYHRQNWNKVKIFIEQFTLLCFIILYLIKGIVHVYYPSISGISPSSGFLIAAIFAAHGEHKQPISFGDILYPQTLIYMAVIVVPIYSERLTLVRDILPGST